MFTISPAAVLLSFDEKTWGKLFKLKKIDNEMNKFLEILLGLILVIAPIVFAWYSLGWGFWNFGTAAWEVIKGGIIVGVVMIGLLFLMLGISDLKE
jgi:uncharacterized membrane protein